MMGSNIKTSRLFLSQMRKVPGRARWNRHLGHGLALLIIVASSGLLLFRMSLVSFSLDTLNTYGEINMDVDDGKMDMAVAANGRNAAAIVNGAIKYAPDIDVNAATKNDALLILGTASTTASPSTQTSSWYGWQPEIHLNPDCKWARCFGQNHSCQTTCRDEPEVMGNATLPMDLPHDWVPDVTMLRRMFLAQQDANGNPWPPPLSTELCEPYYNDKHAIKTIPIVAKPLLGTTGGPKILCMIYTMASEHPKRVRAIRETWAGGCDGFLAFSTETDPRIPAISIPHDGEEAYKNMWQKVRSIWTYVGEHFADDFDFFYLGGDDLFVLPQNLRSYLATAGSPDSLLYAGRPLKNFIEMNVTYNSGGAGYVLSRGTLQLLAKGALNDSRCEPERVSPWEDVLVARCLDLVLGIGLADTRDAQGRHRFHPFSPGFHYKWRPVDPLDWFHLQTRHFDVKVGAECCAPDSISFHYLKSPAWIRHLFSVLYDSRCKT